MKLTGMEAVKDKIKLARLAGALNITRGAVAQWDQVPAERLGAVSRITGIPISDLRPDLFEEAKGKRPAIAQPQAIAS